ncbi:MAG: nucleoside 2-deoxyribosyltransferase [bacterium]
MAKKGRTIYCAGPLFNELERKEMKRISDSLEKAGFRTFLPQRDGLRLNELLKVAMGSTYNLSDIIFVFQKAIFELDAYQVLKKCDGLVLNINGRVPDEGAIVEGAWAWLANKPLIIYKSDERSLMRGLDNPLVIGLNEFTIATKIKNIPEKLKERFKSNLKEYYEFPVGVRGVIGRGEKIYKAMAGKNNYKKIFKLLTGIYIRGEKENAEKKENKTGDTRKVRKKLRTAKARNT